MRITMKQMAAIKEARRARAKQAWITPTPVQSGREAPARDYQATVASRPGAIEQAANALCCDVNEGTIAYAPDTGKEAAYKTPEQTLDFSQYFFCDLGNT